MPSDADAVYVCQLHHAHVVHVDLRLEIGGVLVSWAVPKGPSPDPAVRRLAIRTDDHALEHASYEGAYGRGADRVGSVVVWDLGTYSPRVDASGRREDPAAGLAAGHLVVDLHGRRLTGLYALTRTGHDGDREQWVLVKTRGEGAEPGTDPLADDPTSVLTGRSNADLERAWREAGSGDTMV